MITNESSRAACGLLLAAMLSCSGGRETPAGKVGDPCDATRPCEGILACAGGVCISPFDGGIGPDAACGGGGGESCNLLTQTGCNTGEKCTWIHDACTSPGPDPSGVIGCSARGEVPTGGACSYHPPATATCPTGLICDGADDCVIGDVCTPDVLGNDVCSLICDNNTGGTPSCPTGQTCVTVAGLFAPHGQSMSPAGVCAPSCDPLADNAFQGSDVGSKTGITCGSSNAVGCYGFPSDGSGAPPPTHFICALFAGGYTGLDATGNLVHRSPVPLAEQFLNSCAPGYNLSIFLDATGSAQVDCFAFCAPANSYGPLGGANVGTAASGPNGGKSADGISHQCNTTDARGAFGATATPGGTNGEHCTYTWLFELDENTGALHLSPTSDTVGICIDHTKYRYDSNGDGTITAADAFWPACPTIPLAASGSNDPLWAGHFGCVDHTHGGPDGGALGVAPSGPSHFVMERPHPIALRRSMR